jgi:hypothetical protein
MIHNNNTMKAHRLILSALAGVSASAFAGTPESVPAPAPMQEPVSYSSWFAGGSFGRLYDVGASLDTNLGFNDNLGDLDFDMYSVHVGRRFDSGLYGFNTALYLEAAFLDGDLDFDNPTGFGFLLNQLNADIDILPVTINGMLERNVYGGLGVYLGGGVGYGFTEIESFGDSDRDGGFYAQATAGLTYKFTDTFEVFGGARWVYLESLEFADSPLELDDGFAWEAGLRFSF